MAVNTKIQFRRGYSLGYAGVAIGGLAVSGNIWQSGTILAPGELGLELDTGKFKIGKDGITGWSSLPYAGGSAITAGSGTCISYDSNTNTYTVTSEVFTTGSGLSVSSTSCGSGSGNAYTLSLNNRLQEVSKLTGTGLIASTSTSGVAARTLTASNNITITNGDGVSGNPTVSLSPTVTGVTSITTSQMTVNGSGTALNVTNDVNIGGTLSAVQINLNGISCSGNIGISGDLRVAGSGSFASGVYVNGVPVSLSGHTHSYTDVTNFCSGVASCVNTALTFTSGVQAVYSSGANTLSVSLSGQALAIHTLSSNGIVSRTSSGAFSARTIGSGDTNVVVTNGDGVSGNPTISLAQNLNVGTVTTTGLATVGGNLVVAGDLTVNGDTVITNVSNVQIEDPIIILGQGSGVISGADVKDRGLELRYISGGVASTGFMGYDQSTGQFMLLTNATNTNEVFSGTSGTLSLGAVNASGIVTARTLSSTVASGTAPFTVTSPTKVNNLNADLLDDYDSSYFLNAGNLSGTLASGRLPSVSQTNTSTGPTSSFVSSVSVDTYGRVTGVNTTSHTLATTGTQGIASFDQNNFSVTSGAVSIKTGGVSNTNLVNSSVTIGSTPISLGATGLALSGLTTIAATTSVSGASLFGNGSGITNLNATNLSTGTVSSSLLSGTYNIAITGSAGSVVQSLTVNNGGAGDASPFTFNGSAVRTISYNSIGAPSISGANATGTWNIGISGTAANATNINISSNNSSLTTTYLVFTSGNTGNQLPITDANLTYNASTDTLSATNFSGNGSALSSLNANNLSTGTVPLGRLPLASTTTSGIAIFSSNNFAVDASGLVTIKSGGVSTSNLVVSGITIGSTIFNLGTSGTTISGLTTLTATTSISGALIYGDGSNLTNLNASNIASGTLNVNRLPTNIPITNLASSGITFGSTFQALGSTVSSLFNLTAISGTSAASPTTLTFCVIDGGTP